MNAESRIFPRMTQLHKKWCHVKSLPWNDHVCALSLICIIHFKRQLVVKMHPTSYKTCLILARERVCLSLAPTSQFCAKLFLRLGVVVKLLLGVVVKMLLMIGGLVSCHGRGENNCFIVSAHQSSLLMMFLYRHFRSVWTKFFVAFLSLNHLCSRTWSIVGRLNGAGLSIQMISSFNSVDNFLLGSFKSQKSLCKPRNIKS